VVQRQVLYLGEINDGQREAWCQLIEAFDEGSQRALCFISGSPGQARRRRQ
jgi:hypothetical protein